MSLQDRKQPDVCEKFFHDVPFEAHFASDMPELQPMSAMPGVDGFTVKVDALYKVRPPNGAASVSRSRPENPDFHLIIQVIDFPLVG